MTNRCTLLNSPEVKECEACGHSLGTRKRDLNSSSSFDGSYSDGDGPLKVRCEHCQFDNPRKAFACETCHTVLPQKKARSSEEGPSDVSASIQCPQCLQDNLSTALSCTFCGLRFSRYMNEAGSPGQAMDHQEKLRTSKATGHHQQHNKKAGAWGCRQCSFENPPDCLTCGCCRVSIGDDKTAGQQASAAVVVYDSPSPSSKAAAGKARQQKDDGPVLICAACTYINDVSEMTCVMCRTPLQDGDDAPGTSFVRWPPHQIVASQKSDSECGTSGIIEALLRVRAEASQGRNPSTIHMVSPMDHYCQRQSDILGQWSCGYRNIQMLLGSLVANPTYRPYIFGGSGFVPQVQYIQRWIEAAWDAGFDPQGAIELGRISGTSKWIGSGEVCGLCSFFGLRSQVVHINTPQAKEKSKSKSKESASRAPISESQRLLGDFVWRYFTTPWESFSVDAAGK